MGSGVLEFIDTNDMTTMSTGEHFMAGELEWDPTGRYVVSSVSFWRHQNDTGFYVWSFQGKLLQRVLRDKFYQILWRPRPPTLLTGKNITVSPTYSQSAAQTPPSHPRRPPKDFAPCESKKNRAVPNHWDCPRPVLFGIVNAGLAPGRGLPLPCASLLKPI